MVTKQETTKTKIEIPTWKQTKGFRFETEADFLRVQSVANQMAMGAPVDMATALRALVLMALPEAEKRLGITPPATIAMPKAVIPLHPPVDLATMKSAKTAKPKGKGSK
jgi:hypothetical protein